MNDNSNKRTQRTPAEIIAETEAKLERLRMKEAKQQAQSDPVVAGILDQKAEVQKEIREAKKVLGSGPQSASARIAKHEAWIEKINDSVTEAEDTLFSAETKMEALDQQLRAATETFMAQAEKSAEA